MVGIVVKKRGADVMGTHGHDTAIVFLSNHQDKVPLQHNSTITSLYVIAATEMAATIPKPPPISLIHQVHRVTPLAMVQPTRGSNAGPWQALMEAHIANITSHKAMLETLAQSMSGERDLDTTLVTNMEAMYTRTVEIMDQAQDVQAYFNNLTTATQGQPTILQTKSSVTNLAPKAQVESGSLQRGTSSKTITGRRQRGKAGDATAEDESYTKRRRVAGSSTPTELEPQVSPQDPAIEYVDVSKEVLRRLAASRERRMAKQVAAFKEADDAKRKRLSSGSEQSVTQVDDGSVILRPKKRLKSKFMADEDVDGTTKEIEEDLSSGKADREGSPRILGAFDHSKDKRDKKKLKRTKSIV